MSLVGALKLALPFLLYLSPLLILQIGHNFFQIHFFSEFFLGTDGGESISFIFAFAIMIILSGTETIVGVP